MDYLGKALIVDKQYPNGFAGRAAYVVRFGSDLRRVKESRGGSILSEGDIVELCQDFDGNVYITAERIYE